MDRRNFDPYVAAPAPSAAFSAIGIWFRLLVLGVVLAVGGIAMLFEPDHALMLASGVALGGAVLALLAWRKLRDLLREEDGPTPDRGAIEPPARRPALAVRA